MAQLNDHILNEWQKHKKQQKKSEVNQDEMKNINARIESLKKEASIIKIENKELTEKC